ncbi:MAG: hypothetical protein ACJ735_05930 [Actinomycetes bacterium]
MYVWLWRKLPGGRPGKVAGSIALLLGTLALLFFVIFPWAEPRLPFNHVTVTPGGGSSGPVTPGPTSTPTSTPTDTPAPSTSALPGD